MNRNKANIFELIGFGMNNSATNAQFFFILVFFFVYCTESIGLSALIVGILMTVFRLFDGITDPIIGMLIDKTDTKYGKFRPFMFWGMIIMNISFLILFWGVKFDSILYNYIWISFWYIIWVIGYTCCTACTKGAQSILTKDNGQRSMVSGIDMALMVGLNFLFFASGMIILKHFGGTTNPIAFRKFSFIPVILTTFFTLCAILGIWKKDNNKHYEVKNNSKIKLSDYMVIIKENRALQMLILAASTNKIGLNTVSAATFYFFTIIAVGHNAQLKVNGPQFIIGIIASFLGIALAVKMGRKKAFILGTWFGIFAIILAFILRPFDENQLFVLVAVCGLIKFGSNLAETHIIPMIADVVDYEYHTTGRYSPGMISTMFSFIDKMVSSISGLLIGAALGIANYVPGGETTPLLYGAILFLYFGVPLLGHIFSIIAMKYYPIDMKVFNEIQSFKEKNEKNKIYA
ncbi:MAG: MFS transporter [Cetobacterium sp.]|uniref:MFS transporter n=1 Tax=Cetobacterium sp. TaxID=2071632 RepID=UPI003F36E112